MRTRVTQLPRDCSGGEEAASTGALVTAAARSATSAQHLG
jgi:hypothetical protein